MHVHRTLLAAIGATWAAVPALALARGTGHSPYKAGDEWRLLIWLSLFALVAGCVYAVQRVKRMRIYPRIERYIPDWELIGSCVLLAFVVFLVWLLIGLPGLKLK